MRLPILWKPLKKQLGPTRESALTDLKGKDKILGNWTDEDLSQSSLEEVVKEP